MKVALVGVGSLGTIMGALISKNGGDITLVDVNKEHVKKLNDKGAIITGKASIVQPVKAITPDKMEGTYDLVILLVKQTYNDVALKQILPHLRDDSVVCTLQNGVPEIAVAEVVGIERTIGGTVGWGATWLAPGKSMLTTPVEVMSMDIGEIDGNITDRIKKIKDFLNLCCPTKIVTNLMGYRWTKLLVNSTFSGMSVALGCTYGDILDNKKALLCAMHIANEAISVAEVQGIKLEEFQGFNVSKFKFTNKNERELSIPYYELVFGVHRAVKASMLQDLEKGRKCEIDAINGLISMKGRVYGIKTPVNDQQVEIVHKIQDGKLKYEFSNIDMFIIPEIP